MSHHLEEEGDEVVAREAVSNKAAALSVSTWRSCCREIKTRLQMVTVTIYGSRFSPCVGINLSRRRLATSKFGSLRIRKLRRKLPSLGDSAVASGARQYATATINCEYEEVCFVWPWAGRSGTKEEGPSARRALRYFRSGDQTATTLCLALPWTTLAFRWSLGPGLLTACWPLVRRM